MAGLRQTRLREHFAPGALLTKDMLFRIPPRLNLRCLGKTVQVQRPQHLQSLSQRKALALGQQLAPHSEIGAVHLQQLPIQLGAVKRHGLKFGLKGVRHIHHRVGGLRKIEADGGALPGRRLRTPGILGQGGGD